MTSFPKRTVKFTNQTALGRYRFYVYRCGKCKSEFCVRSRLIRTAPEILTCMDCGKGQAGKKGIHVLAPKPPRFELIWTKAGTYLSMRRLG